jgi:general L-amino acid transport system substrate-binding protein
MRIPLVLVLICFFGAQISASPASGTSTLDAVKKRGSLKCGVHPGLKGFAARGPGGRWEGLDVDFCRAVAAATLLDAEKVEFIPVDTSDRLAFLKNGNYDILSRSTTWTLGREADFNILFIGITFYDGQGFMTRRSANIRGITGLRDKKICVQSATTSIDNLRTRFNAAGISYVEVEFASADEVVSAYKAGQCDAITTDLSALYSERTNFDDASEHVMLPDVISKEPLGPAVRMDDPAWFSIVRWVYFALIEAEELGITQSNVRTSLSSSNSNIRAFLGLSSELGSKMGLSNKWAYSIIESVGNYGEIFAVNVGSRSKLQMNRGLNSLWSERGLLYSPPIK